MVKLGKTFFHVRAALARVFAAERALEEPLPALPAARFAPAEHAEFRELLGALGAEAAEASALERKEREVAELQHSLELLRPLGQELARLEQERIAERAEHAWKIEELRQELARERARGRSPQEAAVARQIHAVLGTLAELEAAGLPPPAEGPAPSDPAPGEGAAAGPDGRARPELERALEGARAELGHLAERVAVLSQELAKRSKALERSEQARRALRARFEERDRLASERWRDLRLAKKRIRELELARPPAPPHGPDRS